jgi:hypothetical protein
MEPPRSAVLLRARALLLAVRRGRSRDHGGCDPHRPRFGAHHSCICSKARRFRSHALDCGRPRAVPLASRRRFLEQLASLRHAVACDGLSPCGLVIRVCRSMGIADSGRDGKLRGANAHRVCAARPWRRRRSIDRVARSGSPTPGNLARMAQPSRDRSRPLRVGLDPADDRRSGARSKQCRAAIGLPGGSGPPRGADGR